MVLPRMAALCESQWCAPENKNYEAFLQRVTRLVDIYKLKGWNYASHIFDVMLELKPNSELVRWMQRHALLTMHLFIIHLTELNRQPLHRLIPVQSK